jgi:hypothetical protein
MPFSRPAAASIAALGLLLAGCATTKLDASWSNPEFAGKSLRGQTVLVACQARDFTTQAVCEDQIAARLATAGVKPVKFSAANANITATNDAIDAAAKRDGARAIFRTTLATSVPTVTPGPTIGIGVGGGGTRVGGAGGITLPIGGGTVSEAYAADSALIDTASGKLMWSGRATSPTGGEVAAQLADLTRVTFEALAPSGLL